MLKKDLDPSLRTWWQLCLTNATTKLGSILKVFFGGSYCIWERVGLKVHSVRDRDILKSFKANESMEKEVG
jgi:hypothetical protein